MEKQDISLVDKFKNLEQQLFDSLKDMDGKIDFDADKRTVLKNVKAYIMKVKEIDNLFSEYEKIASMIEKTANKDENNEFSSAVIDLREQTEEYKTEVEFVDGNVKVKKSKKKNTPTAKEF